MENRKEIEKSIYLASSAINRSVDLSKNSLPSATKCYWSFQNAYGDNSLHHATSLGYFHVTSLILSETGDELVNVKNGKGLTALEIYLNKLCLTSNYSIRSTAWVNVTYLLGEFIHSGANIHTTDKYKNTLLHFAAHFNDLSVVSYLTNQEIDIDVKNPVGQSPLFFAFRVNCQDEFIPMIKLLLTKKANINLKDRNGYTPFLMMIFLGAGVKTIEFLIKNGADIFAKTKSNVNALHYVAVTKSSFDVRTLQRLIDSGLDVNCKTITELETPLHWSVKDLSLDHDFQMSRIHTQLLLICHGAKINEKDIRQRTPLLDLIYKMRIKNFWKATERLDLLLFLSDLNILYPGGYNILFQGRLPEKIWKKIVAQIAYRVSTKKFVSQHLLSTIDCNIKFKDFFKKCEDEISRLKETLNYGRIDFLFSQTLQIIKTARSKNFSYFCKLYEENDFVSSLVHTNPIYSSIYTNLLKIILMLKTQQPLHKNDPDIIKTKLKNCIL